MRCIMKANSFIECVGVFPYSKRRTTCYYQKTISFGFVQDLRIFMEMSVSLM